MAHVTFVEQMAAAADYFAIFAIARSDGSVQATLVKAGVLEDPDNGSPSVGVVVGGDARKLVLLRQSGRATVVFARDGQWVAVEGRARLEGPDDPLPPNADRSLSALLRTVFLAAGGTHDDWDEFDRVMARERRTVVFVRADRISTNS
ncbi:MAG TPA: hypothetical protein VEJ87_11240 [Acidimicrobiales bacterium]|nr:hypothetical protein [Acidimicrobiales bacterium]